MDKELLITRLEENTKEIERLKKNTKNKKSKKDYDRMLEILENTKKMFSDER
jgi:ribosome-binding ATPase YchF (GTP1/OBG family)